MKKILLSIIAIVLFGLIFVFADAGNSCGMMGYSGMMSGSYGSGMMRYGWLNSLLVTIILVLLVAWLIKHLQKK